MPFNLLLIINKNLQTPKLIYNTKDNLLEVKKIKYIKRRLLL